MNLPQIIVKFYTGLKRITPFTCLFLIYFNANTQDMTAFCGSAYSGIASIWFNPVNFLDSKYKQDISISAFQLSVENNCFYLPKEDYRFSRFFGPGTDFPEYPVADDPDEKRVYKDYFNINDKSGFINLRYQGPGCMIRYRKNSFGITTAMRFMLDFDKVPYHAMKFFIEGVDFIPIHKKYFTSYAWQAGLLGFAETTLNFARKIYEDDEYKMSLGINLKYLSCFAAAYIHCTSANYIIPNDDLLHVFELSGDYGYSMPVDRYEYKLDASGFFRRGTGYGADIGFSLQKSPEGSYLSRLGKDYKFRLSISLVDIGTIKIKSSGAVFGFMHDSTSWFGIDTFKGKSLIHLDTNISIHFKGSSYASETGTAFTMYLPATVIIQADFNPVENFYVDAALVYGIKINKPSVRHPAVATLSFRYDHQLAGIFVPISLYDWNKLRLGIGFRLFSIFYAGTDKIGGFFNWHDCTGFDLYFGLKCGLYPPKETFKQKKFKFKANRCFKF